MQGTIIEAMAAVESAVEHSDKYMLVIAWQINGSDFIAHFSPYRFDEYLLLAV
jgi:hypothetical protein